jgi:hypothetical protein
MFALKMSEQADQQLSALKSDRSQLRRAKAVGKALRFLAENPRHPSLNTHVWTGELCPHGEKQFEAYAENNTPGAYRIFFCYAPGEQQTLYIVAITPHP